MPDIPSDETGTMSIHNGSKDQEKVVRLGWEGVGSSPLWTRALKKSERLEEVGEVYDRFLSGNATLGELLQKINEVT